MRKTFKHLAMAALASALIAGQATTAFAFKNDTNNGPGSGKSTEVSLQAPGDNSDSSQSSGNNTSPTTIVEESSQSTDTSQSETSQTTETTTETTTDTTTAAETVTEDTSAQVPTNQAFLQVQLLRASDQVWSDPVRDDSVLSVGDAGFLSMCIYANNLPGDVLYRTYSSSRGWTNWAMNGGHTDWSADCPVEAVQIRLMVFSATVLMFITAPIFLTEQNVTGLKTAAPTALWPAAALSPACASPCGAKELTALLTRWTIH